ncbi:MAG: PAS domain-containing sensor histidine kinase [bacterium]
MLSLFNTGLIKDVQLFMDTIGDGIFVVDSNGTIVKSNQAICDMLGYCNLKSVIGQPALALLGATDEKGNPINKRNAALFKSIKKGKKVSNAARQFTKSDGTKIWTSITTTPILKNGDKVKGAILVVRDITEQKLEEEYRSDFAHIASHDLRTPLGNLLWVVEYLLSGKSGQLNEKQREYMNDTYSTLREMNRMVNDLLSVSRLQTKKIKPKISPVSFELVIKKVIKDLDYYAKAQNVKIKLSSSLKKGHLIKVDQHHLKTIVQNIIENAIRYSFSKTQINVNIVRENGNVIFSCSNNGIGIPKDKQKFIFAKFFRAKNAIEKQGDGTGLGMYITKEVVKLNKGEIWFNSVPNAQTTFYVKF